jgi:uncharacterized protein (DUF2384 family)
MPAETAIAAERALLERVERFAQTQEYQRLRKVTEREMDGDPDDWLVCWLMRRAFSLGRRPIDIVGEPGGVEMLADHLVRIAHNCA